MDFKNYISRHRLWSRQTFGEGERTEGIMKHIEKEVNEVRICINSTHVRNWKILAFEECIDIIILAIDAAWRLGFNPNEIEEALAGKQIVNFRKRPKNSSPDEPTEHIKENKDGNAS